MPQLRLFVGIRQVLATLVRGMTVLAVQAKLSLFFSKTALARSGTGV